MTPVAEIPQTKWSFEQTNAPHPGRLCLHYGLVRIQLSTHCGNIVSLNRLWNYS